MLNAKNPFAANYVHVGGEQGSKCRCEVRHHIQCDITPSKVLCSYQVRGRFDVIGAKGNKKNLRERIVDETLEEDLGLEDVILRLDLHAMLWCGTIQVVMLQEHGCN